MIETKLKVAIKLPGSIMYSNIECALNKGLLTENKVSLVSVKKNGKKTRTELTFSTRQTKPAIQSINISKEAYYAMIEEFPKSNSTRYNKFVWSKMPKKERLKVHLKLIAESLGGELESYEIFED